MEKSIYYVNADDTSRGIANKQKVFELTGIKQVAPGKNGFVARKVFDLLDVHIANGSAPQTTVIIDTVKKLVDLLDSRASSEANEKFRAFVGNGGTIIGLGHVNKHKNEDGEPVYKGTSDVLDEWDAAWIGTPIPDGNQTVVNFKNIKRRGDLPSAVSFSYERVFSDWLAMFESVSRVPASDEERFRLAAEARREQEIHCQVIDAITNVIRDGCKGKSELLARAAEDTGESKTHIEKILNQFAGQKSTPGKLWRMRRGDRGVHIYELLD